MSEEERPSAPSPRLFGTADNRTIERILVRSALRVLAITFAALLLALLAWKLRALLLLVVLAFFVAALLHPAVVVFTRRGLSRLAATILVYLVLIAGAAVLGFIVVHPVYSSATHFAKDLPNLVRQAQQGKGPVGHLVTRLHLAKYVSQHSPQLQSFITRLGKPALSVGKTVLSGVASLVTIGFVSFFVLLEVPSIFNGVMDWMDPERARVARRVTSEMARQVTGFMLGDFATSVIAGIVVFVTLEVTGVPFATVLAIWVGFVDFLPLVGGLLAGVPTVAIAFLHSIPAGIVMVVVFLIYQQIENHILYPIIVSRSVRLNPLWVLLSVLIGSEVGALIGSTFGAIAGAILGVPIAGSIQVAGREILAERRGATVEAPAGGSNSALIHPPRWRRFLTRTR